MPPVPKVRAWSNTVRKGDLGLSDLDLYVMRDVPEVLAALGRRRSDTGRDSSARHRALSVVHVAALVAPFLTVVAFGGPVPGNNALVVDGLDDGPAAAVAATCFVVALPGPVLLAGRWWRSHRHWSWAELAWLVATVLVGVVVLRAMSTEWGVGGFGLPTLPVWSTVAIATALLVAVATGSRGRRTTGDQHFPVAGPPDEQRVRELVEQLPPRTREQLLDMRSRALDTLVRRSVVDESRAVALLESVPLGLSPITRS